MRPSLCILAIPMFLYWTSALVYADEQCEFTNPNPTFHRLTPEEEKLKVLTDLGEPPSLNAKELQRLERGRVVLKEIGRKGDAKRMEAYSLIAAPPSKIMAFLKDFKSQVGKMPHLKKAQASWNGNLAQVEFWIKIAWKEIYYKLNVYHFGENLIEWEFVCGGFKTTSGYWKFHPMEDGKKTLVVYHVFTDPGLPLPDFIVKMLTYNSMPDVVLAVKKAVETKK